MTPEPEIVGQDRTPIRLVIFDWAGTTVDHGSLAPVYAFHEAFRVNGVEISHSDIRGPMGLHKKDHIRELFGLDSVASQWREAHGCDWSEDDVQTLYETFMPVQVEKAQELSDVIPGVAECIDELRSRGILVGASTGYPRIVADPIIAATKSQGYHPDANVCADEVPGGRPAPWMIFRNMEQLGVFPPPAVLKIGDTRPDILAGLNAGVRTLGISETGSEVGLSAEDFESLSETDQQQAVTRAEEVLATAGAEAVLRRVADLPQWLDETGC
ncbi:MAG: phosphonoacetaldehyde hydrolase [Planctomycetaceae bacterium]|nr:phosphonoacetaldehyde hydrolase [Planctomycetaceae bacterium]